MAQPTFSVMPLRPGLAGGRQVFGAMAPLQRNYEMGVGGGQPGTWGGIIQQPARPAYNPGASNQVAGLMAAAMPVQGGRGGFPPGGGGGFPPGGGGGGRVRPRLGQADTGYHNPGGTFGLSVGGGPMTWNDPYVDAKTGGYGPEGPPPEGFPTDWANTGENRAMFEGQQTANQKTANAIAFLEKQYGRPLTDKEKNEISVANNGWYANQAVARYQADRYQNEYWGGMQNLGLDPQLIEWMKFLSGGLGQTNPFFQMPQTGFQLPKHVGGPPVGQYAGGRGR